MLSILVQTFLQILEIERAAGTLTWSKVTQQGDIPSFRYQHTAAVVDDHMILFGGQDKEYYNDVYSFDFGRPWFITPKILKHNSSVE